VTGVWTEGLGVATDWPNLPLRDTEMARLIRDFDWAATALGPIATWPAHLRATVSLMLHAEMAMVLLCGDDGRLIYNDAYASFAGARHPAAFGVAVRDAWPEVAAFNANVLDQVLHGGRTLAYRDHHLVLERNGSAEDVWMNLDYSPICDAGGRPDAVLAMVRETTDRVRAEQRLRIAQDAGRIGVFEWYPDTGRLEVSDEFRRIWGLGAEVAVTDGLLLSLLHPDDLPKSGPQRLATANPLETVEYRRVDPVTGEVRWIARQGEVVSSQVAGRRRFIGVATDITARKEAEAALRLSEARWRGLFEQMHEGFFVGEAIRDQAGGMQDFTFREINPAFEAQTGIRANAANGQPCSAVIEGLPRSVLDTFARVMDTGEPAAFEVQVAALDHRWFEARARRVGPERFAVMFLDISARKAAEQAVMASENRFRSLAQSMPNHVWTATADGRLDWVNERCQDYAGLPVEALQGEGWAGIVHPEDRPHAIDAWTRSCATGMEYVTEFRLRRADGIYRWHLARAVPALRQDGSSGHWIGTNTDIEARKSAEAALAELAATLEDRAQQRSAELVRTQDALRQSQKMHAIGNLTGGVAHDFNNLLQVMGGNLQLLTTVIAGDERAERLVRHALDAVARGAKLTSQLLAFGRRQPLAPKVVSLGRLVGAMDDILTRTLGEGIALRTVIAEDLWRTLIDPGNVENAILNLAINARDAMAGRGTLTIAASNASLDAAEALDHADVTPGQYVLLSVSDDGCGMAPEILEEVFEPFFTTKPEGKGSGLGLSMVYGFVKQSGGHIKIDSAVGVGTTIRIYLPRSDQAEEALYDADAGPVTGGSETVLVAEDDDAVRETVVGLLGGLGYRVLKARDAESALAIVESGVDIDLLFTDVVMPGRLSSAELGRQARLRQPGLRVLFTSGYTENSIVHGGRLDAGVELLGKPYTRDALARKLRHVLGNVGEANLAQAPVAAPFEAPGPAAAVNAARPLTCLVCEDEWIIRASTVAMLEQLGHTAIEAGTAAEALALLAAGQVDVLLTDVGLPDLSGVALAAQARALHATMPVVFVTGYSTPDGVIPGPLVHLLQKPFEQEQLAAVMAAIGDPSGR